MFCARTADGGASFEFVSWLDDEPAGFAIMPASVGLAGGGAGLGYPRTVVRADGQLVTAYYFHHHADGERYIAATIWRP